MASRDGEMAMLDAMVVVCHGDDDLLMLPASSGKDMEQMKQIDQNLLCTPQHHSDHVSHENGTDSDLGTFLLIDLWPETCLAIGFGREISLGTDHDHAISPGTFFDPFPVA